MGLRKIVTDRYIHVFPGLFSGRLGVGVVEESMGPSEMQCTFLGGL